MITSGKRSAFVLALAAIAAAPLSRADADWMTDQTRSMTEVFGTYTNRNYGFAVTIPAGTRGFMQSPPSPNHGVLIILGDHREIEVSASFEAAFYGSSPALLAALLSDAPQGPVAKSRAVPAGRPAVRATTRAGSVNQDVVAQWVDHAPADAVNTQAVLTTTRQSDEAAFAAVLTSFRYTGQAN